MLPSFDNTEIAFKYRSDSDMALSRFLFGSMQYSFLSQLGISATQLFVKLHLPVKGLIRKTIFRQFCGGETMQEAGSTASTIGRYKVGVILDYGVESKEEEDDFDNAAKEFINAIHFAAKQGNIPFVSLKVTALARFALLEKIHGGQPLSAAEKGEWLSVQHRMDAICKVAYEKGVMILIDAEETWIVEPVNILADAMMEKYNRGDAIVFNTFQLYCKGTLSFLKSATEEAARKGYTLGAKLVRGAYMEKERERAARLGYDDPIQPNKQCTDKDFDDAVKFCLQNLDKLALFIGTHNEQSCMDAVKQMQEMKVAANHPRVFFSQLYGMGDNISFNLAESGYRVAKYLPYGPVKDVIPYLMRRAQENTSVAGQVGRELSLVNKEIHRRTALT